MVLEQYIDSINKRYALGNATEHTFRGDLQQLLESLLPGIRATNEPKRQACGAPDYILTKNDIPVGFIEAKDIGDNDLDGTKKNGNKEQFDRYKASLGNIVFTDYLDFRLYNDGVFITKIAIAEIQNGKVLALPQNFAAFTNMLQDFCLHVGQTIKSPEKLAEMMAGKARLLAGAIEKSLINDGKTSEDSTLKEQMDAFKQILIHDITPKGFADVYSQTIAYGMFAARLHDAAPETFSRQKAAELIPKSNPFLRKLFGYIAGPDIDGRIKWIVDGLADIFLACDVAAILKNYGKATQTEDPIIHFYETFLGEYDPQLRKARGVWYTPAPVVKFIVRAVDDILKTEFGLPDGLADTGKLPIKDTGNGNDQGVHRVQILDPATGTGTFLAEVIKHIRQKFAGQEGAWGLYVENHLLPRLNGFELLMASYAMAHLKLDLLLTETGYKPAGDRRLRVYLTNSLEESHPDATTLFAGWLSAEANEANNIKRDVPVMCVIGNPPYSGESANKGEWIAGLMEDYKKEPGGKEKLKERNPKWINDDYVKFLRRGQHFIEKNGSGVLAFINPHGFLDNPTFRGMRWNLLKTYDKIYTIDLHGNSKKKETAPDGGKDENVFDIMQGVSINLFVKTGKKKPGELGKVFHFDLFGKRAFKYGFLNTNSIGTVPYKELPNIAPDYFFVPKDFEEQEGYSEGFAVNDLFTINSVGIVTANDSLYISTDKKDLKNKITKKYAAVNENLIRPIAYRPFDNRFLYNNIDMIERGRIQVMKHFLNGENIALSLCKQFKTGDNYFHAFVTDKITESSYVSNRTSEITSVFPLYLYPDTNARQKKPSKLHLDDRQLLELRKEELMTIIDSSEKSFKIIQKMYASVLNPDPEINKLYQNQIKNLDSLKSELKSLMGKLSAQTDRQALATELFEPQARIPNLNPSIIKQMADSLGMAFVPEKTEHSSSIIHNSFAPIDVLDYIYAVLHSPAYREKYAAFLKIDFPRVPYPKNKETFWRLVQLGSEIRQIHLLESPAVEQFITQFPEDGDNSVAKAVYQDGKVYINATQYFDKVPEKAWGFHIGGYQPAQKWLKDRQGHQLGLEDICHYQKIIAALSETDRLMTEIDTVGIG